MGYRTGLTTSGRSIDLPDPARHPAPGYLLPLPFFPVIPARESALSSLPAMTNNLNRGNATRRGEAPGTPAFHQPSLCVFRILRYLRSARARSNFSNWVREQRIELINSSRESTRPAGSVPEYPVFARETRSRFPAGMTDKKNSRARKTAGPIFFSPAGPYSRQKYTFQR
jgi:hypothetical protein